MSMVDQSSTDRGRTSAGSAAKKWESFPEAHWLLLATTLLCTAFSEFRNARDADSPRPFPSNAAAEAALAQSCRPSVVVLSDARSICEIDAFTIIRPDDEGKLRIGDRTN
jgi:hypothetical protein